MAKKILSCVLFLVCALVASSFTSCSDEDPADVVNPYAIRFKTDLKVENDNSYLIPADGGTYTFDIYNGEPWLSMVKETFDDKSVVYIRRTPETIKSKLYGLPPTLRGKDKTARNSRSRYCRQIKTSSAMSMLSWLTA